MASSIHELYGDLWGKHTPGFAEDIEQSTTFRETDPMFEWFGQSGLGPDHRVLDVGSRDAHHAVELAQQFGCRCIALDPISLHREYMKKTIAEAGLSERVTSCTAAIEALPFGGESVDAIWCHDVLNHVDLPRGLAECTRVLKPGGPMFVFVTLATDRCEPKEAARLWASMAIVPENMQRDTLEHAFRAAGFEIAARERIDSERREWRIEKGESDMTSILLRLARMRRREEELVRRYGRLLYEATYGSELWGVYQLLGKLCPMEYLLRKL
jgi:ubiquinone/menaquinone biosynthesis C-methylase UbiE